MFQKNIDKNLQVALLDTDASQDAYLLEVSINDSNPHNVMSLFWFTPEGVHNDKMFTGSCEVVSSKLQIQDHARMMLAVQAELYAHFNAKHETIADIFDDVMAIGFTVPHFESTH